MIYHTFGGYKPKTVAQRGNKDAVLADLRVKFCPSCSKCWEVDQAVTRNTSTRTSVYYDDFVRYGKEKVICEKCEVDK